ncbi:MAG: DUF4844 domain-containing protein [Pseudoxanthomonas sp.]
MGQSWRYSSVHGAGRRIAGRRPWGNAGNNLHGHSEPKFPDSDFYPEPEAYVRDSAESLLNEFVQRLIDLGTGKHAKSQILQDLRTMLHAFDRFDPEDQDQLMIHLYCPLDILNIESSDGLTGEWRYGSFFTGQ